MSQVHPETGETPEEVKERLDNARDKAIEEHTEKQQRAIDALASVEDVDTEVVNFNGEPFEVYTSVKGSVARKAAGIEDLAPPERIPTACEVLAEVTAEEEYNKEFWLAVYDKMLTEIFLDLLEALTEPALNKLENEEQAGAMDGFRPHRHG